MCSLYLQLANINLLGSLYEIYKPTCPIEKVQAMNLIIRYIYIYIYVTKNEKIAQKVKTIKFKFMEPIDSS